MRDRFSVIRLIALDFLSQSEIFYNGTINLIEEKNMCNETFENTERFNLKTYS